MFDAHHTPAAPGTDAADRPRSPTLAHPRLNEDGTLATDLDIAFSTHLTVVVPARLEFGGDAAPQDVNLVIARTQCRDSRPRLQALLDAAQSALGRSTLAGGALRRPQTLSARVAGQWHALWAWPTAGAGPGWLPAT